MTTPNPMTHTPEKGKRCTATSKQTGQQCGAWATPGHNVCKWHGSGSPQARDKARLRLFDLVDPSLTRLARLIATTNDEQVLLKAVNSVLDRTGYQRGYQITIEDARAMLAERLTQAQETDEQ